MEATFWGVRGSYPVPGPGTVRFGGHTSCVEMRNAAGDCLIVDAGTGLRGLGKKLAQEQARASSRYNMILSHVHWDHIQGLPFFEPAYLEGSQISIYALRAAAEELRSVIGGITRHEFFPIPLEEVPARFEFHEITPGQGFALGGFQVTPFALNHPFGAVGYRLDADGTSMAYVADTAPFDKMLHKQYFVAGPEEPSAEDWRALGEMKENVRRVLRDVDTVIYDTHFLPDEYERFPHWGHSTPDQALEVCAGLGVRQLVLYHHAPSHDDDTMDQVEATYRELGRQHGMEVVAARESLRLVMGVP